AYKRSRSNTSSPTGNTTTVRGRKTASSTRLNRRKYAELLSGTLPRIIEDDAELERVAQRVEPLLDKGARRTREEEALCRLLLRLIEELSAKAASDSEAYPQRGFGSASESAESSPSGPSSDLRYPKPALGRSQWQ